MKLKVQIHVQIETHQGLFTREFQTQNWLQSWVQNKIHLQTQHISMQVAIQHILHILNLQIRCFTVTRGCKVSFRLCLTLSTWFWAAVVPKNSQTNDDSLRWYLAPSISSWALRNHLDSLTIVYGDRFWNFKYVPRELSYVQSAISMETSVQIMQQAQMQEWRSSTLVVMNPRILSMRGSLRIRDNLVMHDSCIR